jgi:hypothetical protein
MSKNVATVERRRGRGRRRHQEPPRLRRALMAAPFASSVRRPLPVVLLLLFCLVMSGPPTAGASGVRSKVPAPKLSHYIPATAKVLTEKRVKLTAKGPDEVVVTYVNEQTPSAAPSKDAILLAWDGFAHRWVNVFDAAKADIPGGTGNNPVIPPTFHVIRLGFSVLRSARRRADLAFWAEVGGASEASVRLNVLVVHFNGQTTSVEYGHSYTPPSKMPFVTGKPSHQKLVVTAGWKTVDDPDCCEVRTYRQTVALTKQREGSFTFTSYVVTSSTQSWLGVYVGLVGGYSVTAHVVVVKVAANGPSLGVLEPGDELLSVAGVELRTSPTLGPPVIDEVARELPGTHIALTIIRSGVQQVINITLGSRVGANAQTTVALRPESGYLGVGVSDATGTVDARDHLSGGVLVQSVATTSVAQQAGLAGGDVITSVGSSPVASVTALEVADLLAPPGTTVPVSYVNQTGAPVTVTLKMGYPPQTAVLPVVTMM